MQLFNWACPSVNAELRLPTPAVAQEGEPVVSDDVTAVAAVDNTADHVDVTEAAADNTEDHVDGSDAGVRDSGASVDDLGVDWAQYRTWDLVQLTQNYLLLFLKYIRSDDTGTCSCYGAGG